MQTIPQYSFPIDFDKETWPIPPRIPQESAPKRIPQDFQPITASPVSLAAPPPPSFLPSSSCADRGGDVVKHRCLWVQSEASPASLHRNCSPERRLNCTSFSLSLSLYFFLFWSLFSLFLYFNSKFISRLSALCRDSSDIHRWDLMPLQSLLLLLLLLLLFTWRFHISLRLSPANNWLLVAGV